MTGKSPIRGRVLALLTTLAALSAILVPFAGPANAQFTQGTEPFTVTITPSSSSASVGVCNPMTVTVTGANGQPVRGQTVIVRITQNTPPGKDLAIGFCVPQTTTNPPSGPAQAPDAIAPATAPTGNNTQCPPPGGNTRQNTVPAATPGPCANTPTQVTNPPNNNVLSVSADGSFSAASANGTTGGAAGTGPATVGGSQPGQIYFGVATSDPGSMQVQARVVEPTSGTTRFSNTHTKTWTTAGGGTNAASINCTWDQNDQNQNQTGNQLSGAGTQNATAQDTNHSENFTCIVKDAQGANVAGANVRYTISGVDAPSVANTPSTDCGNTAVTTGAAQCTVTHSAPKPGTSTITAYVEVGCANPPPGATSCSATQPDNFEVKITLTKQYQGAARSLACGPATATNVVNTTHTVTCTATDVSGGPAAQAGINARLSGNTAARFESLQCFSGGNNAQNCTTNTGSDGKAAWDITSTQPGEVTITLTLNPTGNPNAECAKVAGNPPGSQAGVCTVIVKKTYTTATTPAPHGRSVSAGATRRCNNPPGPRPRRCRGIIKGKVTDLVDSPHAACESGVTVVVQHKGTTRTPATDTAGNYSASFRGSKRYTNGNYNVSVAGNTTCGPASASAAL